MAAKSSSLALKSRGSEMPEAPTFRFKGRTVESWVLLAATVAYALLSCGGLLIVGQLPAATETGQEVVAWFRDNDVNVRWLVWMLTLAIPMLSIMVALLRRLLPPPHREVFIIGSISYLVAGEVMTWIWAGLALHPNGLRPPTARSLLDVAIFFGPALTGSTITMIGPVTLLGLYGSAGIPRWLTLLGAVAFVEQSVETITIFGSTGFTQPGGAMNLQLGAALTLAWLIAFGLWGGICGRADGWANLDQNQQSRMANP